MEGDVQKIDDEGERKRLDSLIKSLRESRSAGDLDRLNSLVEHVRADGLLYSGRYKQQAILLELLLEIGIELASVPASIKSEKPWWFIMTVYDIIFHQVRLKKCSAICSKLYFDLSDKVIDPKFHELYNINGADYYGQSIYFIKMAFGWFTYRTEEFLELYKKLTPLFNASPNHLERQWIERYQELNALKK